MQKLHFLELGLIGENIRKRSVLKKILYRSKEMRLAPGTGRTGGCMAVSDKDDMVIASGITNDAHLEESRRLFYCVRNDLLCMGATPIGFTYNMLLQKAFSEESIRETMAGLGDLAKQYEMDYLGGNTQTDGEVVRGASAFTMFGKVEAQKHISNTNLKPGMDLVMTKMAGIRGTVWLTENDRKWKLGRLPEDMLETAWFFGADLCGQKEAEIAWESGVTAMQNTSHGGVFGDLWCFAEASNVGISVDLKAIPIRQETIEICEVFHLNPYMIPAGGAFLLGTYDGKELVKKMNANGCRAAVIGRVTEGKERVVVSGDEKRVLLPHSNEKEGNIYEACKTERKR